MLAYAKRIGLDANRFQKELDSEKYRSLIQADLQEAQRRAVLGAPVFFLIPPGSMACKTRSYIGKSLRTISRPRNNSQPRI